MALPTRIKAPALPKPKLRGRAAKAAKIAFLKRSAASKRIHHHRRMKHLAHHHLRLTVLLIAVGLWITGVVIARVTNLIPPPAENIDMAVYEKAAAVKLAADIKEAEREARPAPQAANQIGRASWYALGLRAPDALTCASTTFPRGTRLLVTNLRNGRQVTCLVNDYGPQPRTGKVLDLSRGAFRQIESLGSGVAPVEIRVVR